jgi:hypothetical protein
MVLMKSSETVTIAKAEPVSRYHGSRHQGLHSVAFDCNVDRSRQKLPSLQLKHTHGHARCTYKHARPGRSVRHHSSMQGVTSLLRVCCLSLLLLPLPEMDYDRIPYYLIPEELPVSLRHANSKRSTF